MVLPITDVLLYLQRGYVDVGFAALSGCGRASRRSCRRTCRPMPPTRSRRSRSRPRTGRRWSAIPSATTGRPCCGSPTSARSSTTRPCSGGLRPTPPPTWWSTSTRPRAPTHSRAQSQARIPGATGAQRRGYGGAGQDQRGQGRACCRAAGAGQSAMDVAAATRAIAARAERLDPKLHDDGVRRRGARRQGVPRRDASGWGDRGGGLQPEGAARCPGVVPGRLGRPRRRVTGGLHHQHRPAAARRRRPVDDVDAAATGPRRAGWSRRVTPSRSPGWRRCTRASAAPEPGGKRERTPT